MNREDTKQIIEVMQAYVDGAEIEIVFDTERFDSGFDIAKDPTWNWDAVEYRIKPKPREFWIYRLGDDVWLNEPPTAYDIKKYGLFKVREVL